MTPKQFDLTDEHIRLLRHAYITWDDADFGAPAINPTRPYGNSDVIADIARILGVEPIPGEHDDAAYPPGEVERFRRLHAETEVALQIVLATGEMRPGRYRLADSRRARSWVRDEGDARRA